MEGKEEKTYSWGAWYQRNISISGHLMLGLVIWVASVYIRGGGLVVNWPTEVIQRQCEDLSAWKNTAKDLADVIEQKTKEEQGKAIQSLRFPEPTTKSKRAGK